MLFVEKLKFWLVPIDGLGLKQTVGELSGAKQLSSESEVTTNFCFIARSAFPMKWSTQTKYGRLLSITHVHI